jgi:hypothetical protein
LAMPALIALLWSKKKCAYIIYSIHSIRILYIYILYCIYAAQ